MVVVVVLVLVLVLLFTALDLSLICSSPYSSAYKTRINMHKRNNKKT
jgi:hypothetical protein